MNIHVHSYVSVCVCLCVCVCARACVCLVVVCASRVQWESHYQSRYFARSGSIFCNQDSISEFFLCVLLSWCVSRHDLKVSLRHTFDGIPFLCVWRHELKVRELKVVMPPNECLTCLWCHRLQVYVCCNVQHTQSAFLANTLCKPKYYVKIQENK